MCRTTSTAATTSISTITQSQIRVGGRGGGGSAMTVNAAVNAMDASEHTATTVWLRRSASAGTGTRAAKPPDVSTGGVASRRPSSHPSSTVPSAQVNPSPAMRIWSPRCPLAGWSAIAAAGAGTGGGGTSLATTTNAAAIATDLSAQAALTVWPRASASNGTGTDVSKWPAASTGGVASEVSSSHRTSTVPAWSVQTKRSPLMRIGSPG